MALELEGSVKWLRSGYLNSKEFFGAGCAEKDDVAFLMQVNLKTGADSEAYIISYAISTGANINSAG